ncbi:extracellular solute-binding protein [Niastella caeni]|uniref:Extracellular solute-binding protein n=1 Tax=Niastella caeni TaxID=2569763 RepID=A0A4S8H915_9BACT|nr:extracellular solute-binding protein [Niastella caeni]THU31183.1 extracellular solute-binding protein [Niastella caeni]
MSEIVLNGITWGHSRGITPLLAAAQRYSELYPNVTIQWKKRTLQEFADFPLEKLVNDYDLLIIDHPWVGCAAATNSVLPLDEYLPAAYLQDQSRNTVGDSHISYYFDNHQWALAIDAATPAASYRANLLQQHRVNVPDTWDALMALAKEGKVAIPAIPIDILMNFYMFCIALGEEPFRQTGQVVSKEIGVQALQTMRELYSKIDKKLFACNPIQVAELMSSTNDYWYCPFAYCYSNYSRLGYAKYPLTYANLVWFGKRRFRSTIGGTGLAVSSYTKHKQYAVDFAAWVCSEECQRTFYVQHGGQPGHLAAWTNNMANVLTNSFFHTVLPVMKNGYMRPRYNGYLHFQDHAGDPVQQYMLQGGNPETVLEEIDRIYQQSLVGEKMSLSL